jgi:hypothetical protein
MQVGQRVRYSAKWLRSVGCYTGDLPQARGKIVAIQSVGERLKLATIEWDDPSEDVPTKINVLNLERCQ